MEGGIKKLRCDTWGLFCTRWTYLTFIQRKPADPFYGSKQSIPRWATAPQKPLNLYSKYNLSFRQYSPQPCTDKMSQIYRDADSSEANKTTFDQEQDQDGSSGLMLAVKIALQHFYGIFFVFDLPLTPSCVEYSSGLSSCCDVGRTFLLFTRITGWSVVWKTSRLTVLQLHSLLFDKSFFWRCVPIQLPLFLIWYQYLGFGCLPVPSMIWFQC